jgi:hypothetical protein
METSNPRVLNAWLLFVTILVIVVAFAFYSFVYVKNNEKEQIAKRFRVLAQVGENIIKKEKGFRGVARYAGKVISEKTEFEEIKNEIKKINQVLNVSETKPGQGYLEFPLPKDQENMESKENICAEKDKKDKPKGSIDYFFYVSPGDFFEPLKRPDVFDEFIVFEEKNKLADKNKQEDSDNTGTGSSVLYQTFPGDIYISGADELKSFKNGIESGCLKDVTIANRNYKLFLQSVKLSNESSDRKWYVGGLIDETKFSRETRQLEAGTIIPLLIIFTLFLLAIPLLKLFLMSRFEQLNNKDVILNTLSITFGTILLILLVLFFHHKASDTNNVGENLDALAQKIKENFTVELQKAYKQLEKYDHDFEDFIKNHEADSKEFELRSGDNVKNFLSGPDVKRITFWMELIELTVWKESKELKEWKEWMDKFKDTSSPSFYNLFKIVFWMDSNGKQILQFFTRNHFGPLSDLGHRKYFQEAGNWRFPDFTHDSFMLESITSITSGEKLAAVSMKSDLKLKNNGEKQGTTRAKAAALTTKLASLIDTIVPVGYGFCVIDDSGKVWFHSNSERNLQENFIDEVEKDKELRSAVYAKQSRYIDLDYQSKDHKCFIMPLANMPLYIVTFHDLAYTHSVQTYILLYTFFSLIILFAFYGLLFVITAGINYRKSLLKGKYVSFTWLRPLKEKRDDYQRLIISNLVIILFLIIFKWLMDETGTIFLCISSILFSFTYNYFILTGKSNKEYRLRKHWLLVFFLVLLLTIDFIAWLIMDKFLLLIMFQGILLIIFGIIKITGDKPPSEHGKGRIRKFFKKQLTTFTSFFPRRSYNKHKSSGEDSKGRIRKFFEKQLLACTGFFSRRGYVCFLLSWLVLSYLIPSIMFYLDAYKHENEVALKYHQLKLAQNIENRNIEIDKFYRGKMDNYNDNGEPYPIVDKIIEQRQHSGIYANIIGNTRVISVNPDEAEDAEWEKTNNNSNFDEILYRFKPSLNSIALEKRNLLFPTSSDRSRTWWKANNKIYLEYRINNSSGNNDNNGNAKSFRDNNKLYVVSNIKYPGIFSSWFSLLMFCIVVFLILVSAYFLILTVTRKIFSWNLPGCGNNERTHSDTETEIREAVKAGSNLIIYCKTEKEMEYCVELFDKGSLKKDKSALTGNSKGNRKLIKAEPFYLNSDNRNLEEAAGDGTDKIVLIENFQLYVNDIQGNLKKINRIIPVLRSPGTQVVIPTFTPLTKIIESYGENLSELTTKKTGEPTSTGEMKMKLQLKEIIDLLNEANDYLVSIYPHLKTISKTRNNTRIKNIKDKSVKTLILNEFKSFEYFENKKIQDSLGRYYRELEEENENLGEKSGPQTKEKIILKIQELSQHYYKQFLNSCTRTERYVLYDFSQNMLVNSNNLETIDILLKKGLMVYDGTFKLMNESFRNFILSAITPGEAKDLVKGLNGHVNWKSYKALFLLIAMGVAVFLAFQESLLTNVNAIITTVIGGIAMLTKASGIFSINSSK